MPDDKKPPIRYPEGPNHALLIGEVAGVLSTNLNQASTLSVTPEVLDGKFTNRIFIQRPSGTWVVTVQSLDVQEHLR